MVGRLKYNNIVQCIIPHKRFNLQFDLISTNENLKNKTLESFTLKEIAKFKKIENKVNRPIKFQITERAFELLRIYNLRPIDLYKFNPKENYDILDSWNLIFYTDHLLMLKNFN